MRSAFMRLSCAFLMLARLTLADCASRYPKRVAAQALLGENTFLLYFGEHFQRCFPVVSGNLQPFFNNASAFLRGHPVVKNRCDFEHCRSGDFCTMVQDKYSTYPIPALPG
jgi:hypothetical protein